MKSDHTNDGEGDSYKMTFEDFYGRMKEFFAAGDYAGFGQGIYTFEFNATGDGGGIFYIELRDGALAIQPFDYKDSLCSLTAETGILLAVVEGSLSPVEAYSSGRLTLRGDVSAAFLLADALSVSLRQ